MNDETEYSYVETRCSRLLLRGRKILFKIMCGELISFSLSGAGDVMHHVSTESILSYPSNAGFALFSTGGITGEYNDSAASTAMLMPDI